MTTVSKVTVEELMKPRVKIIAPWPICSKHTKPEDVPKVGQVFYLNPDNSISNNSIIVTKVYDYPHLFNIVEWWEDREPGEMPEYVKNKTNGRVALARFNLDETSAFFMFLDKEVFPYSPGTEWIPSDQSEYLTYLNAQK